MRSQGTRKLTLVANVAVPAETRVVRRLRIAPLAALAVFAAAGAAQAAPLNVVGVDATMLAAVDIASVKHDGDEATLDLVMLNGDPVHQTDTGPISTVQVVFDCKGARGRMLAGVSQLADGSAAPYPARDWSPATPGTPLYSTVQLICRNQPVGPDMIFPGVPELTAFYADYLNKHPATPQAEAH